MNDLEKKEVKWHLVDEGIYKNTAVVIRSHGVRKSL